jgi:hypothetical protein
MTRKGAETMMRHPLARTGLLALALVAPLAIGNVRPVRAEDVPNATFYDEVDTEVIESYPEASAVQPEAIGPVASGGSLVRQPPQENWDRVEGIACVEPEPFCESLP